MRVGAEGADQRLQLGDRGGDPLLVGSAYNERDAEIAAPEIRVGADFEIAIALLQRAQILRDRALAEGAADAAAQDFRAALEAMLQLAEDRLHDLRHPGQDKDVLDAETRGARDRVG